MKLEFCAIEVRDEDGAMHDAMLALCGCVGSRTFHVFHVGGQTHFHLQCTFCGEVYCPLGACESESQNHTVGATE